MSMKPFWSYVSMVDAFDGIAHTVMGCDISKPCPSDEVIKDLYGVTTFKGDDIAFKQRVTSVANRLVDFLDGHKERIRDGILSGGIDKDMYVMIINSIGKMLLGISSGAAPKSEWPMLETSGKTGTAYGIADDAGRVAARLLSMVPSGNAQWDEMAGATASVLNGIGGLGKDSEIKERMMGVFGEKFPEKSLKMAATMLVSMMDVGKRMKIPKIDVLEKSAQGFLNAAGGVISGIIKPPEPVELSDEDMPKELTPDAAMDMYLDGRISKEQYEDMMKQMRSASSTWVRRCGKADSLMAIAATMVILAARS